MFISYRLLYVSSDHISSKENIFNPLGMKSTTFYLTPELNENKIPFNIRRDGKLYIYDPTERLFETDPEKGDFR